MSQDQKIVKDERGQDQPADKKRAQQNTAAEGGAGYAPRNQDLKGPAKPGEQAQGLSGEDKRQGSLRDAVDPADDVPEGLRRERTHPLSPTKGRGNDNNSNGDQK